MSLHTIAKKLNDVEELFDKLFNVMEKYDEF